MARSNTSAHEDAEKRMLELIRNGGLEEPDEVSYEFDPDEVHFLWHDTKLVVIIELDEADGNVAEREPGALAEIPGGQPMLPTTREVR